MERAQTLERVGPGTTQLDVVADDILDADLFANGGNVAFGNPTAAPRPAGVS